MTRTARLPGFDDHASFEAARQEALRSGKSAEVALAVTFPGGNPFPKGRLPNLNVTGPDGNGRGAFPYASKTDTNQAAYYLLLHKGASYTVQWMFSFGGKEIFGHFVVPTDAPERLVVTMPYRPARRGGIDKPKPVSGTVWLRNDQGFVPPKSDGDFKPPRSN